MHFTKSGVVKYTTVVSLLSFSLVDETTMADGSWNNRIERGMDRILYHKYWLIDTDIDGASRIIRLHFPNIQGLQDVCVVSALQGSKVVNPFLQMIHSHKQHWSTITTIGCPNNTLRVYDSMYRCMDQSSILQIESMINWQGSSQLTLEFVQFQKQRNKADCGLFAVAAAFSIVAGNDPSKDGYDDSKMRKHFYQCLATNTFNEFPKYTGTVERKKCVTLNLSKCTSCKSIFENAGVCKKCKFE